MVTPSPLPSFTRAFLVVLFGVAPALVEAAVIERSIQDGTTNPSNLERALELFGLSESLAAVQQAAPLWTAYLRIAAVSIALYDYITTIPAEWRLYMAQPSFAKMSRACILFIGVRYMSIAALVTSNVGFFGNGFSPDFCRHYHLAAPLTKLFACLISQIIVSIRTYAISRKESWVKWTLTVLFFASMAPEFLGNVYERKAVQNHKGGNCTSGNLPTAKIAWIHYLAAMIFDAVVTGISTFYLILHSPGLSLMSNLSRLMLKEGIVYFICLTAVNILNLVMFRASSIAAQSGAACLGQAVTMIMSQRIILGLYDWRTIAPSRGNTRPELHELSGKRGASNTNVGRSAISTADSAGDAITITTTPGSNYNHDSTPPFKSFVTDARGPSDAGDANNVVHVRVEHDVKADYDSVCASSPGYSSPGYPSPGYLHPSEDHKLRHEKYWAPL